MIHCTMSNVLQQGIFYMHHPRQDSMYHSFCRSPKESLIYLASTFTGIGKHAFDIAVVSHWLTGKQQENESTEIQEHQASKLPTELYTHTHTTLTHTHRHTHTYHTHTLTYTQTHTHVDIQIHTHRQTDRHTYVDIQRHT